VAAATDTVAVADAERSPLVPPLPSTEFPQPVNLTVWAVEGAVQDTVNSTRPLAFSALGALCVALPDSTCASPEAVNVPMPPVLRLNPPYIPFGVVNDSFTEIVCPGATVLALGVIVTVGAEPPP
jgi:hypothetical protein